MTTTSRRDPLHYLGDELDGLKTQGLYRQLRILEGEQRAHTTVDHRSVVNLSSNNYLGLTTHPRLRERALEAVAAVRRRLRLGAHHRRAPWRSTWSSSAGSPSSSRPKRSSSSRAASPPTPAPSSSILTQGRRRHLRRAEPRQHHRRLPPEPRDDQGVPAQGRRRRAHDPAGAAGGAAQAAHHRRRVQHGRRPRPAAGAVRARRGVRLHHDGRRRACERRVRQQRPRHDRSLRHARPRRHPGRHAVEGDRRARRLRRRQPRR